MTAYEDCENILITVLIAYTIRLFVFDDKKCGISVSNGVTVNTRQRRNLNGLLFFLPQRSSSVYHVLLANGYLQLTQNLRRLTFRRRLPILPIMIPMIMNTINEEIHK